MQYSFADLLLQGTQTQERIVCVLQLDPRKKNATQSTDRRRQQLLNSQSVDLLSDTILFDDIAPKHDVIELSARRLNSSLRDGKAALRYAVIILPIFAQFYSFDVILLIILECSHPGRIEVTKLHQFQLVYRQSHRQLLRTSLVTDFYSPIETHKKTTISVRTLSRIDYSAAVGSCCCSLQPVPWSYRLPCCTRASHPRH